MPTSIIPAPYVFDPTGTLRDNLVTNEQHILTGANSPNYYFFVPKFGPFFEESLVVSFRGLDGVTRQLTQGIDFYLTHWFIAASRACAKPIFGSISILDTSLKGVVTLQYQSLGGDWLIDEQKIAEILADTIHNPRITSWDVVTDIPYSFPVIDHQWDLADLTGAKDLLTGIEAVEAAILQQNTSGLAAHLNDVNPHRITPVMIGTYDKGQIDALLKTHGSNHHYVSPANGNNQFLWSGKINLINTKTGPLTVAMPDSPVEGDAVEIRDVGGMVSTNPLTIMGGDQTIEMQNSLVISDNFTDFMLWFDGIEWIRY